MQEENITFPFTGRYFKTGDISTAQQVWFILHGYGQLAEYFIRKFRILYEQNICVIAPEGLSRFYLGELLPSGRKHDRVGATWMTKEARNTDIQNYITYLNEICQKELSGIQKPVTVLGFSQGAATATRWVLNNQVRFNRLILWSGMLPTDMDTTAASDILKSIDVHVVYGTKDPFINDTRFSEMKSLITKSSISVKETLFDGGHDIHENTLARFIL